MLTLDVRIYLNHNFIGYFQATGLQERTQTIQRVLGFYVYPRPSQAPLC
jgi:hypothetical protein